MRVERLLDLIPPEQLTVLAVDTKVDRYAKKLQGAVIFKLLLHCILTHKDNSLRTMQSAYETLTFQLLNQNDHKGAVSFSSISERLSAINVSYFEKLYTFCVSLYKEHINPGPEQLMRFDSTIVALSTKLLGVGYQLKGGDAENFRQLKFTVAYSSTPEVVHFYHDQRHNSENVALKETIMEQAARDKKSIKVFDRGITARQTWDDFTEQGISFITRVHEGATYKVVKEVDSSIPYPITSATLSIISDQWCSFFSVNKKKTKYPLRRIEALRIKDGRKLVFLSNNEDMTAEQITELYKRRWDIEVFFKFIKGLLNFKHLLNRSENGIKVVLYATMIAAILVQAYKKTNNLKGFKIPKQKLTQEIETEIIKHLITLCGGNPQLLNSLPNHNTS
jgi:hypothetical protein